MQFIFRYEIVLTFCEIYSKKKFRSQVHVYAFLNMTYFKDIYQCLMKVIVSFYLQFVKIDSAPSCD